MGERPDTPQIAAARIEVERTRGRLIGTAQELQDRLSPKVLARNTWQLWAAHPNLPPGKYTIKVRAVDGTGTTQTPVEADTLPDGASGYHTITIAVA